MNKPTSIDETSVAAKAAKEMKAKQVAAAVLTQLPTPPKEENKSFIVRNVTANFLSISDLKITIEAHDVLDLTHEDSDIIKASKDLRNALKKGLLTRITEEEWDRILDKDQERQMFEMQQAQKQRERITRTVDGSGREHDVELINLEKFSSSNMGNITTAGDPNDPNTYAMAYAAASAEYRAAGKHLDSRDFAEMTEKNPSIIQRYVAGNIGTNSVMSGERNRGKATVMFPGEDGSSRAARARMSNFARDGMIGGIETDDQDDLPNIAEAIDLSD